MIKNITQRTIISRQEKHLKTDLELANGLMFAKKPKSLIFYLKNEQRLIIHMFFVFFPIDLIFLNKNKKVIELKENIKPFHIYITKKKLWYLIEVKKNTISNTKTKLNDQIEF
jgi:uncharacterized protein